VASGFSPLSVFAVWVLGRSSTGWRTPLSTDRNMATGLLLVAA